MGEVERLIDDAQAMGASHVVQTYKEATGNPEAMVVVVLEPGLFPHLTSFLDAWSDGREYVLELEDWNSAEDDE